MLAKIPPSSVTEASFRLLRQRLQPCSTPRTEPRSQAAFQALPSSPGGGSNMEFRWSLRPPFTLRQFFGPLQKIKIPWHLVRRRCRRRRPLKSRQSHPSMPCLLPRPPLLLPNLFRRCQHYPRWKKNLRSRCLSGPTPQAWKFPSVEPEPRHLLFQQIRPRSA